MTHCRRVRPLIGPYLYHDLDDRERSLVDSHLQACARCRAEVASCRDLVARLPQTLPAPTPQARARILQQVESRIAASARRPAPSLPVQPGWRLAFAGAAAALLLGLWIGSHLPQTTPVVVTAQPPAPAVSPAPAAVPEPALESPTAARPEQQTSPPAAPPEASDAVPGPAPSSPPTARIITLVQAPGPSGIDDVALASVSKGQ